MVDPTFCKACKKSSVACTFDRPIRPKGPAVGKIANRRRETTKRDKLGGRVDGTESVQQTLSNLLRVSWTLSELPDDHVDDGLCLHLMSSFREHVSALYPIFTGPGPITDPFVLNGVLCLASRFSWLPTSFNPLGMIVSPKSARSLFMRAKHFMPMSLNQSNLQTVQGLIVLLLCIAAFAGASTGWTWTGASATSLAQLLQLDSVEVDNHLEGVDERVEAWNTLFELDVNAATIFASRPMLNPASYRPQSIKNQLTGLFSQILHCRASSDAATLERLTSDLTAMEPLLDLLDASITAESFNTIVLHACMTTYLEAPMMKSGSTPGTTDPDVIFGTWYNLPSFPLMYRASQRVCRALLLDTRPRVLSIRGVEMGIGLFRLSQVVLAHSRFTEHVRDDVMMLQLQQALADHGEAWIVSKQLAKMMSALHLLSKVHSASNSRMQKSELVSIKAPGGPSIQVVVPESSVQQFQSNHREMDEMVQESDSFFH